MYLPFSYLYSPEYVGSSAALQLTSICPSGYYNKDDPNIWTSTCGDGIKVLEEEWDDGNKISQDGCSSTWQIEQGFEWNSDTSSKSIWIYKPTPKIVPEIDYAQGKMVDWIAIWFVAIQSIKIYK